MKDKYRCVQCEQTGDPRPFVSWAACERHADTTPGHCRFAFSDLPYWPTEKTDELLHPKDIK